MVRNTRNASGGKLVPTINSTEIEGVKLIQPSNSVDSRGRFIKFNSEGMLQSKLGSVAVSINPYVGTVRGLHLQIEPFAEEKLVSCIQGSTFEVIVDIRNDSKSFGKVATFELSQENALQVYIPKGVAHGFQTLLPETIVHYFLTSQYSPDFSYSIDPFGDLGINWPIEELSVSDKDSRGLTFTSAAQLYAESLRR